MVVYNMTYFPCLVHIPTWSMVVVSYYVYVVPSYAYVVPSYGHVFL